MTSSSKAINTVNYVQACVTTVSFPENLLNVFNMVKRNKSEAKWSSDLDVLLNFKGEDSIFWTAPEWLTEGDILFFYHTKRAKIRTTKLLAEAQERFPQKRNLINLLKRAKDIADQFSGCIFACALVSDSTQLFEKQEKHFISSLFAPINKVHIFDVPLPQELFSACVKIGLGTITPLYNREFDGIKRLLSKENDIPSFLQESVLGDDTFKNTNAKNWRSISCLPNTRFIHEAQLRNYLLDFFLKEIKDKGTSLLEECECFRGIHKTGRVDYFIKIFGRWIPVEAKLNLSKERNIFAQTAKYININAFSPSIGKHRNKIFKAKPLSFCFVLDQNGIYLISASGNFINCGVEMPLWRREEFTKDVANQIREKVKTLI